jgi:hypothetical protein
MDYVIQPDMHVDEKTQLYGETGLYEVFDTINREVYDCCMTLESAEKLVDTLAYIHR